MNLGKNLNCKFLLLILFFVFKAGVAGAISDVDADQNEDVDPILKQEPAETFDPHDVKEKPSALDPEEIVKNADTFQQEMTKQVFSLSDRIDAFFGEERTDDESNKSTLKLTQTNYFSERNPQSSNFEVNLNLRFRNLERFGEEVQQSIENFFRSDPKRDAGKPKKASGAVVAAAAKGDKAAQQELEPWYFNWDNRVGVRWPLDVSSAFRWRRNFIGDRFTHRFSEQFGWSTINEWQSITALASDRDLGPKTLFRFVNEFNWALTFKQFSTTHGPSILHTIGERDSISFDIRETNILIGSAWYMDSTNFGVNYRRQADVKWLFFELNPQITLARYQNFRRDFNTTFRFQIVMGNL